MKKNIFGLIASLCGIMLFVSWTTSTDPQKDSKGSKEQLNYKLLKHERLGRGVTVTPLEVGKKVFSGEGTFAADKRRVYISWRLLADDPGNVGFNVYRQPPNGSIVKLNNEPITKSTNYVDADLPEGEEFVYKVVPVVDGKEGNASSAPVIYNEQSKPYKSIKLTGNHTVEKIAVADLDGDGEPDFVTKHPGGNVDPWYLYWKPSTDTYKLEAYKNNGKHLWTYDMGWAIEQGVWYSPYLVYDLDGDGKAEVIVKSGEGDPRDMSGRYDNYVNSQGKGIVSSGAEYITVLNGETGKTITQADWIPREPFYKVNTNHAYNFASRNQLAVAYLDGIHPHIVVLRGTYNLMMVRAYRLIENELKLVWNWDNRELKKSPDNYWGQGAHTTIAADVDGDGCDELLLGSCVLDHNGTSLWTTGLGHPDGMFVGDILPERPGLEIYYNIETGKSKNGMCMVDAKNGEVIWGADYPTEHVHGTGFCSDIDRTHPGRECYGIEIYRNEGKGANFAVMYNSKGEIIDRDFTTIWSVFWDTDNQRELLDKDGTIYDYKGARSKDEGEKVEGKIMAVVDVWGDWREEIITCVPGELRIYNSTILSHTRHNCLMQDPIYRNYISQISNGYYHLPMTTYDIPIHSSK